MRKTRIAGIAFIAILVLGFGITAALRSRQSVSSATAEAVRYQCPMHHTYTSDKPGDCPICGMRLVPIKAHGNEPAATKPGERKVAFYRSPMDPSIHSDQPTKDSMGMDYIPVYEEEVRSDASPIPGRSVVTISSERRQVLGVRSEEVRKIRLTHTIRTVGKVAIDERRLRRVQTRFDGFIEKLYVDYTGQFIRRGDRLLSIYSPDLVATQQEYLLARRGQARLAGSAVRSAAQGTLDLQEAARQRLQLWGIRPAEIEKLEQTGQVTRTLDLYSEVTGYVIQKMAYPGMRVTPADTLYEVADLSHLWVMADVYEHDLASIRLGAVGQVTVTAIPGREWSGRITYIAPTVEEATRTIKVRLEVENGEGNLKPEMYADVFLRVNLGEGVVAPDGAIINAGDRRLVFLDRGEGRFEPREVKVGARLDDGTVQVLSGLVAGDRVVTAANFLLDSESSLKAALAGMSVAPARATPTPDDARRPGR